MVSEAGSCCRCCCSFIFTLGLTALFMWLSLRTSKPTCSIQKFYIPSLDKTLNSVANTSINFDLKLKNGNKDKGINYDLLNLTFYYFSSPNTPKLIANTNFSHFYQGHKKTAWRSGSLNISSVNWTEVSKQVSPNTPAVFRVDLVTAVRFKILFWRTKRERLVVRANVSVNDQGINVNKKGQVDKKGTKLTSGVGMLGGCYYALCGAFLNLFYFYFYFP